MKLIDSTIELTSNIAIVFMSRTKDKLKILYWGGDGFWLLSHQLEESKYKRMKDENNLKSITVKQLEWLLQVPVERLVFLLLLGRQNEKKVI